MTANTGRSYSVQLSENVARAVWAAMHDDDDLAEDYVSIACVHALNHLVDHMGPEPYTTDEWERLRHHLRAARVDAQNREDEVVGRWNAYNEPPF
jgi:hypothetical protein